MDLVAATKILLPIRQRRIDGAESAQDSATVARTRIREPGVYARDIAVESAIEAPDPRGSDTMPLQFRDEVRRGLNPRVPHGPVRQVDIRVDQPAIAGEVTAASGLRSAKERVSRWIAKRFAVSDCQDDLHVRPLKRAGRSGVHARALDF